MKKQIFTNQSIQQAAESLSRLRNWSPYRFSGLWHLVRTGDDTSCYRTRRAAERNARKWGQTTIATLSL